jgi:hypothetical protein
MGEVMKLCVLKANDLINQQKNYKNLILTEFILSDS